MVSSTHLNKKLVSVEGLDGAGKTTILNVLAQNFDFTLVLREPGGSPLPELLRAIIKGGPAPVNTFHLGELSRNFLEQAVEETDNNRLKQILDHALSKQDTMVGEIPELPLAAREELLLFNAARAQLVEERIRPALEEGQAVLLDRFTDSTIAYQGYGRGLDPQEVKENCLQATAGLLPGITFYLKISPQTRLKRIGKRGSADRIESSGDEFFARVAQGFNELADSEPRFVTIDAERPLDEVKEQVLAAAVKELPSEIGRL